MAAQQEYTASVLSTLQSEVASEASPMLRFLAGHARAIVIGILLFIAAIAGYWVYSWQAARQNAAELGALGAILALSDAGQRADRLESYLALSSPDVRVLPFLQGANPRTREVTAWFALMEAARQLQDYPRVHDAWQAIGVLDPGLKLPAGMGMASSLALRNQYREALAVLDGLSAGLSQADSFIVTSQIVGYAEAAGDYDRAVAACEILLALPGEMADSSLWMQKKADLEKKKKDLEKKGEKANP